MSATLSAPLSIDPILILTLSQQTELMMLCAICNSANLVIPCLTCERPQCEECFSKEDDRLRTCKGCRMELELEMNREEQEVQEEEKQEEEEEEEIQEEEEEEQEEEPIPPPPSRQLHLGTLLHPTHPEFHPIEDIERGVRPFEGTLYPSYREWKHAENILVSHIMFTSSSAGIQMPRYDGLLYLVGQMIHRFVNHSTLTTDYMLRYQEDDVNPGHYVWVKYMSTYFNHSPNPHDVNIFYPYPLPLQFHL